MNACETVPVRSALRITPLAFSVAVAFGVSAHTAAVAQTAPATDQRHALEIPAGPLTTALNRFAQKAGFVLSFDPPLAEGKTTQGVNGSHTVASGFAQLLSGTGLRASMTAPGVYTLLAAPATVPAAAPVAAPATSPAAPSHTLREVRVAAQSLAQDGTTEHSGSYTTRSTSTATRLNLSLRETPQSISVMTRQQIEDQGIQSLEDVALQVTGLTLTRGATERTQLRARGFDINTVMADGVPMNLNSDMTGPNTMAMYDHVEVLRGAAGLMQGTGNPSATVNMIRKRPTDQNQVILTGSAGSWNNYRTELDAGGPLNEAKTLRGRTVIAYQDTDSFRDHYSNDRRLAYGTLDADLSTDTTLSVGASYNREVNNGSAWYGLPTYSNGSFLPIGRSTNYTPPWAYWNKLNERIFADLEHRWSNGWKAKLSTHASNSGMQGLATSLSRVSGSENLSLGAPIDMDYTERMRGIDVHASGPFTLLGRQHELVAGATYRNHFHRSTGRTTPGYNFVFDPTQPGLVNNAPYPALGPKWGDQYNRTDQWGTYATTRLNLDDALKLIVGARLDWYDTETRTGITANDSSFTARHKFTPYTGLVYDLDGAHSLYASWTRIFQPQGGWIDRNGGVLPPVTGTNYEAGIKGEYLGGNLNASLSVFKVIQNNLASMLSSSECAVGVSWCSAPAGEVQSKGLELEVAGRVAAQWQVSAGYTFATARHTQASSSAAVGDRFATDQPRHLFKLSTNYRLPGPLHSWRIGGGLRQQSEIYKQDGTARIRQGGYALVDLMLAWQATPELELRLNVNNVFDKSYYESIMSTRGNNGFGAPRNLLLTASYRF